MNDLVLLTGATGYLGSYVLQELGRRDLAVKTLGRHDCDLTADLQDPAAAATIFADLAPRWVIHCAALSRMGDCQRDPQLAATVNGKAPLAMAEAAPGRFLHVSTDLVFAGDDAPYANDAVARPLSVYGMTKAEGEKVAGLGANRLVVRVPLLFGPSRDQRSGATDMLLRAIAEKEQLTLFTDEYRTPLHAADAARGLVDLLMDDAASGIKHLGGYERLSRFDLAMRLAKVKDLPIDWFVQGLSEDPRRPRDVSLVGDWEPGRELEEVLAEC